MLMLLNMTYYVIRFGYCAIKKTTDGVCRYGNSLPCKDLLGFNTDYMMLGLWDSVVLADGTKLRIQGQSRIL